MGSKRVGRDWATNTLGACPVHSRMFSSVHGLKPLHAGSTCSRRNNWKCLQTLPMSPEETDGPQLRTTSISQYPWRVSLIEQRKSNWVYSFNGQEGSWVPGARKGLRGEGKKSGPHTEHPGDYQDWSRVCLFSCAAWGASCTCLNTQHRDRWGWEGWSGRERQTEARPWSEDRNSPWLGPEDRSDTRRPCAVPDTGTFDRGPCYRDPLLSALWDMASRPGGLWIEVVSADLLGRISRWHYSYMMASLLLHTHSPCLSFCTLICLFLKTVSSKTPSWAMRDSTDSAISPSSA